MHNAPPSLNALHAFEAAARHLSLRKAALELNVTPGALSHQIRGLESLFGRQTLRSRRAVDRFDAGGKGASPRLAGGFPSNPGRAGEPQQAWRPARARAQHAARLHLQMAGAAALPLFQRLSGNRRAHFLVDEERQFHRRRRRRRGPQPSDRCERRTKPSRSKS